MVVAATDLQSGEGVVARGSAEFGGTEDEMRTALGLLSTIALEAEIMLESSFKDGLSAFDVPRQMAGNSVAAKMYSPEALTRLRIVDSNSIELDGIEKEFEDIDTRTLLAILINNRGRDVTADDILWSGIFGRDVFVDKRKHLLKQVVGELNGLAQWPLVIELGRGSSRQLFLAPNTIVEADNVLWFPGSAEQDELETLLSSEAGETASRLGGAAINGMADDNEELEEPAEEPEPLPELKLNKRQLMMLAEIITQMPVGEWFQRGDVDFSSIDFKSRSSLNQAFPMLSGTLVKSGVLEHNGESTGKSAYRLTADYKLPDFKEEPPQPKAKTTNPPKPKIPKQAARGTKKTANEKPKSTRKTNTQIEWQQRRTERLIARRFDTLADDEPGIEQPQPLTLEERLKAYLNDDSEIPSLTEADRQKVRFFLRDAARQNEEVPGYFNRHRLLQVWLSPGLATIFDPDTGEIIKAKK